jgi:TolB-like protein/tetratricopeptide (TPR) repeat protein
MGSLIPGYEYDIFISYRQKDNKHDGWVTEFVDNLKGELESTFKEEISLYFDINPHDGLLETHDVDASLKEKLKCLIFIPIISRTYCDIKSFAWEHEFKAFVDQASKDKFGLKIKLPNGNVASRVLPIRIHDLDNEDIKLSESVLGGVLRGIEFIYKSSGVNRPLLTKEENPQDNLNHTNYRDQINKVANGIKEIVIALEQFVPQQEEVQKGILKPILVQRKRNIKKIVTGSLILLALIVLGYIFIPILFKSEKQIEKSIAVLPFINDSPDAKKETDPFINGLMEEILINLQTIKEFRVPGRTSVEQFRNNTTKSIPEIAKELGVNYIVEGSGQKYGNTIRLRVQLIRAKGKEAHLWAESFEQKIQNTNDIFRIQSKIAQAIASELKATINPEEIKLIERTPTKSLDALYFYQKGNDELNKSIPRLMTNRQNIQVLFNNQKVYANARKMFLKALEYDSAFAMAYTGLARTSGNLDSMIMLADIALSYDKYVADAYIVRGNYYRNKDDKDRAFDEYNKALKIKPNSWDAYFNLGTFYNIDDDLLKALDNLQKAASLNRGIELADIKYEIARSYRYAGFYDKSRIIALESLRLDGDSVRYFINLSACETSNGNVEKGIELLKKGYAIDSTNFSIWFNLGQSYLWSNQWEESLRFYKRYSKNVAISDNQLARLGYSYQKNGYKKEAEDCFNRIMKSCEYLIKSGTTGLFKYYLLASVYAFRGDKEKAYENLKHYNQIQNVSDFYINYMKYDPWFDAIRNESAFQKILSEMEAKFQSEHERIRIWLEEKNML